MELAMVLPFLFVLFFGSLEVVRVLETKNSMAIFAREAANVVFMDCLERDPLFPDGRPSDYVDACISARMASMQPSANQILPNVKIAIIALKFEGGAWRQRGAYNPDGLAMRYSAAGGPGLAPLMQANYSGVSAVDSTVTERVPIVVAEVTYDFVPVVYLPLQMGLYEVAIY